MCGINGFLTSTKTDEFDLYNILVDSTDKLRHRGPDSSGTWVDSDSGIYLGHRRLSILDLTSSGAQPMISNLGYHIMCLNGEIYNHLDLRIELEANIDYKIQWKGSSDTETLINCFELWGVETTLKKAKGMFAIALWNRKTNELIIARDRFGEKPLFYGWHKNTFFFSSELKSIKENPLFEAKINRYSLGLYLKHAYVPSPHSIYEDIFKLSPGCFLTTSLKSKKCAQSVYWSSLDSMKYHYENPYRGSRDEAVKELNLILTNAVEKQMMADVPLGAFLSGGVDSTTVVAIMQSKSQTPIKTFSIGFGNDNYNEAHHAKKIAEHLKTDHTELYITDKDALEVIPRLTALYDEPFADSSQIPTFLVSKLASEKVTVSLSGDAADELFGGYNRYLLAHKLWNKISKLPLFCRLFLSRLLLFFKPSTYNSVFDIITFRRGIMNQTNIGDKIHKASSILTSKDYLELYSKLISFWPIPSNIVIGYSVTDKIDESIPNQIKDFDPISQMMAIDLITYLPDDILCKVDRAAMGVSLESRVPFLDHHVMEFAWSLPLDFKIYGNKTKSVLRDVLYKYVPQKLIDRPKMGFGVPLDSWLRGELKTWAENLLDENRLLKEGFLDPKPIREKWEEHLSGKRNWHHQLWVILMFQAWLEKNKSFE